MIRSDVVVDSQRSPRHPSTPRLGTAQNQLSATHAAPPATPRLLFARSSSLRCVTTRDRWNCRAPSPSPSSTHAPIPLYAVVEVIRSSQPHGLPLCHSARYERRVLRYLRGIRGFWGFQHSVHLHLRPIPIPARSQLPLGLGILIPSTREVCTTRAARRVIITTIPTILRVLRARKREQTRSRC